VFFLFTWIRSCHRRYDVQPDNLKEKVNYYGDEMKTIVAGQRTLIDPQVVHDILNNIDFKISELVHGAAKGVDTFASEWALKKGILQNPFPPNYKIYPPKVAPHKRNEQMALYVKKECSQGGALIAIHDGVSSGTLSMVNYAKGFKLSKIIIYVWPYKEYYSDPKSFKQSLR
jgi:hypothetical protein